jgi:hypothetical protein
MTANETDPLEVGVPEQAVQALTAAQERAVQAGHPVVLVQNGFLVRMERSGTTVLKQVPVRKKVRIPDGKRSHEQCTTPAADVCGTERLGEDHRQE